MKGIIVAAALVLTAGTAMAADAARTPSFKEISADAAKNNPVAQNNLGVMYATGNGVKQDPAQAAVWYRKAAEQGYAIAQYNLGTLYERGLGVPKDPTTAKVWYEMAAQQGDAWAQMSLGQLLAPQKADAVAAYKWLYLASIGEEDEVRTMAAPDLKKLAGTMNTKQVTEATAQAKSWRAQPR